jgi:hypothetical protein
MRNLEEINLEGEEVDSETLLSLAALPRLTKLDVQALSMPPKTARALKAACPPWVECLVPAAQES